MFASMLANVDLHGVAGLILLIAAVACLVGGAFRAWHRDFITAGVLVVVGLVLLAVS